MSIRELSRIYRQMVKGRVLAANLGLHYVRYFVGGGAGDILLKVAGNGENSVAHTHFGHAVRVANIGVDLLAEGVGHLLQKR